MNDTVEKNEPSTTSLEKNSDSETKNLPIVAHKGGLELLDAKWELNTGRTVKFRLVSTREEPLLLHPFREFVRRRGNRVGTRFYAAVTRVGEDEVFFKGEMMLAGGGNPLGQGMWVRFWLDDESSHHPFAGCAGRRGDNPGDLFMAMFVELDSDDEPINQEKRKRAERANGRQSTLCTWACARSNDKLFLTYLAENVETKQGLRSESWWRDEDRVAWWIRWTCGIESRKDLDSNPEAAEIFHERIRRPYAEWRAVSED